MPSVDLSGGAGPGSPAPGYGPSSGYGPSGGYAPSGGTGGGGGGGFGGGFAAQAASAALNDSAVQQQLKEAAYNQAQQGYQAAREGATHAVLELRRYVQEGPAGISILCFLGGLATTLVGIIGLLNIYSGLTSPFNYVLNAYLTVFGIVTFLLEADMETFRNMKVLGKFAPFVEQYQLEVFNRAKFLTELRGRAFFYLFVGSLAATQCLVCLLFIVGLWNVLMGVLCLCMSFGINPADHLVVGARDQNAPLYASPHGPP